jgi:hypothetical protein
MSNDKTTQSLDASSIQDLISATNRTTHAVRAFVKFLFIQLATTSMAILIFAAVALSLVPFQFVQGAILLGALVYIVGVFWSSAAGWRELGLSRIRRGSSSGLENVTVDVRSGDAPTNAIDQSPVTDPGSRKCPSCYYSVSETQLECRNCNTRLY